jgi:hypothetical protein
MATLKGQNVRALIYDPALSKFRCVAKSTNCSVTHTVNTDDSSTKDVVGAAAMPTATSQSWQLSVETLEVTDAAAFLTAIKNMEPFTILYDEVSTSNNQTALGATFARRGKAYLNDLTLQFNDREVASKSIQFQGTGELEKLAGTVAVDVYTPNNTFTRGQFVRIFFGNTATSEANAILAACKQLSMHVSISLEDATTKDTEGTWQVQEPTGLSFDISTSALVRSGETITSTVQGKTFADLEDLKDAMQPIHFEIANVGGPNNRTKLGVIVSGDAIITNLQNNNPNRQNSDWSMTLNGYGNYTVGEDPAES